MNCFSLIQNLSQTKTYHTESIMTVATATPKPTRPPVTVATRTDRSPFCVRTDGVCQRNPKTAIDAAINPMTLVALLIRGPTGNTR
jgi:hypothetical protein